MPRCSAGCSPARFPAFRRHRSCTTWPRIPPQSARQIGYRTVSWKNTWIRRIHGSSFTLRTAVFLTIQGSGRNSSRHSARTRSFITRPCRSTWKSTFGCSVCRGKGSRGRRKKVDAARPLRYDREWRAGQVPPPARESVFDTADAVPRPDFLKAGSSRLLCCFGGHGILARGESMNSFAQILAQARKNGPARFVVAQAADGTILEALAEAEAAGFAVPVLVGSRREIEEA